MRGIPSSYSGYETFIGELAPRLAARGHQVTVACRRSLFPTRPEVWNGVRLRYLPSFEHKAFSTLSHSWLAMRAAVRARPDVILAVNAATGLFASIPRRRGVPLVVNVDGMEWLRPKWNRLARRLFLQGARLACRYADAVVTDAEEMHRLYARQFGIDSDYIAYGATPAEVSNPEAVRSLGLEPDRYVFVAGRLVPDNNADLVVGAYRHVRTAFTLAVAGGADYRGNAAERAYFDRLASLADGRVRFLGHVHDRGVFQALCAHSFAYVHAHQYGGVNPSLLQALALGCMVLALNTPFNAEVLDNGRYGVLFDRGPDALAAALQTLCDRPDLTAPYRQRARDRIRERFTWERIADQYERLLLRVARREREER